MVRMTTSKSIIRFDGPAIEGHSMSLDDLLPSLSSLSDLLKLANSELNNNSTEFLIRVNADLKQNCFEIWLEMSQTVKKAITGFLDGSRYYSAQEIVEILGIAGSGAAGLFKLISMLKGKEVVKIEQSGDGKNIIIHGNNNVIHTTNEAYSLYKKEGVVEKALTVMDPLQKDGYESISFVNEKQEKQEFFGVDFSEVAGYTRIDDAEDAKSVTVRTTVGIRRAVYDGSGAWTVIYRGAVQAKIDDEEWLSDFQSNKITAPPGTHLDVDLQESFRVNPHGYQVGPSTFKIKKIHDVILPQDQQKLI